VTGETIDERTYTEDEVREILKRAVEDPPSHALVKGEGITLAELKEIGREVGIEPRSIDDAARSVAVEVNRPTGRLIGGPTSLHFERKVEGELGPDQAPEILAAIRRSTGLQGEVREVLGSLEWSAKGEASEHYVTLTSKDGVTTIQASANLVGGATLTYVPVGVAASMISMIGLVVALKEGSELALILALVLLPILYPILRTVWNRISSSESAKLQQAVDDVAGLIEESRD